MIGHSEGGLIGPMVAAADDDIAFVVMLAGPGVPGSDILRLQQELLFLTAGATQQQVDHIVDAQVELYTVMESTDESAIRDGLRKLIESQLAVSGSTATEQEMEDQIDLAVRQFQSPWMTFFLTYDPVTRAWEEQWWLPMLTTLPFLVALSWESLRHGTLPGPWGPGPHEKPSPLRSRTGPGE